MNNISVEEFKNINEDHEFSARYEMNKREFLNEIRKTERPQARKITAIIAGIAAAMLIVPTTIYAVGMGMSWDSIWKGGNDPEVIASLETNVANPGVVVDFEDGSVLNVISVIYDGNVAVAEYTLSKPGGVDTYYWNQDENMAKGGWFTDNSTYSFAFINAGLVVTDSVKSTSDCIHCYSYMVLGGLNIGDTIDLFLKHYPNTLGEYTSGNSEGVSQKVIQIPLEKPADKTYFVNGAGEYAMATPISLVIGNVTDPIKVKQAEIVLKDGTTYNVFENHNYICGTVNGQLVMCFDRIVNINDIASVTINGVNYQITNESGEVPVNEVVVETAPSEN